jgi:hypothetical protein
LNRDEWEVAKNQSQSEDAKNAVEFKMVPSKASNEAQAALPQAFKDVPAVAAEKMQAEEVAEPVKRPATKTKTEAAAPKSVSDILSDWSTDDDA